MNDPFGTSQQEEAVKDTIALAKFHAKSIYMSAMGAVIAVFISDRIRDSLKSRLQK